MATKEGSKGRSWAAGELLTILTKLCNTSDQEELDANALAQYFLSKHVSVLLGIFEHLLFGLENVLYSDYNYENCLFKFVTMMESNWIPSTNQNTDDHVDQTEEERMTNIKKSISILFNKHRALSDASESEYIDIKLSTADFVLHFKNELLACLWAYLSRDSSQRSAVVSMMRILHKLYEQESAWCHQISARCQQVLGNRTTMKKDEFQNIIMMKAEVVNVLFDEIDPSGSGDISVIDLFKFLFRIKNGGRKEQLNIMFKIYDLNGDGSLDWQELCEALTTHLKDGHITATKSTAERLADLLFNHISQELRQRISFEEFYKALADHPLLHHNLNIELFWFDKKIQERSEPATVTSRIKQSLLSNIPYWSFLLVLSVLGLAIAVERMYQQITMAEDATDVPLVIAKACACKVFVSGIPSDFFVRDVFSPELYSWKKIMIYTAGFILMLLMVIIAPLSTQRLRTKNYTLFYGAHMILAALWFICMFIHAHRFWCWSLLPLVIFVIERARFLWNIFRSQTVVELAAVQNEITFLRLPRPASFQYHPGDYLYINIPIISKTLWRPFTISSSRKDEITLHIRSVGLWTGRLYDRISRLKGFSNNNMAFENSVSTSRGIGSTADMIGAYLSLAQKLTLRFQPIDELEPIKLNWKAYLSGPFTSPSGDILQQRHAILVAGGIGITPFLSVLENVLVQLKDHSKVCPCGCEHRVWFDAAMKLKRLDFFWMTRSNECLDLFKDTFQQIEEEQILLGLSPPLVNLHIYLTGLKTGSELMSTFLQMALQYAHDDGSNDLLTGLRASTTQGRPDWSKVLPELIAKSKNPDEDSRPIKPKVYACGPVPLCKELKSHCIKLEIDFTEEIFN